MEQVSHYTFWNILFDDILNDKLLLLIITAQLVEALPIH